MGAIVLGCGGSKHSTATASASQPSATASASASTTTTATPTGPRPSATTATAPSSQTATIAPSGSAGGTNIRLPARFTIRSSHSLDPSTVSAPAFVAIQLTVVSSDGRQHELVLRTPAPRSLIVPAQGRASATVPGVKPGRYVVEVDGNPAGALIVGGEPGP